MFGSLPFLALVGGKLAGNPIVLVALASIALYATGRFLFRRDEAIEDRRRKAIKLAGDCQKCGLDFLAPVLEDYSVGDYSGMVHRLRTFADDIRDDAPPDSRSLFQHATGASRERRSATSPDCRGTGSQSFAACSGLVRYFVHHCGSHAMIAGLLARKLVMYVTYSAAVTALPVLVSLPPARVPLLHASCTGDACRCEGCDCRVAPTVVPTTAPQPMQLDHDTSQPHERWWCRGPLRRGVRAVALFVTRPWRR